MTRFTVLLIVLTLSATSFAGQQLYRRWDQFVVSKRQTEADLRRVSLQLAKAKEKLKEAQLRSGELWEGTLHQFSPDVHATSADGNTTHDLTAQRWISGEVILDDQQQWKGEISLHECDPGSPFCASGGEIQLRTADGAHVLAGRLSLFESSGRSSYEFTWLDQQMSDADRCYLLEQLGGSSAVHDMYSLVRALYASDNQLSSAHQQLLKHLMATVLFEAVQDHTDS